MTLEETYRIIEGLIFAAPYPLTVKEISEITEIDEKIVQRLIEDVAARYENSGIMLRCVAGGYQFVTRPDLKEWVEKLGRKIVNTPLSASALETLAIIAYQQPVTRSEIEQIRGVRADSAINTLLERELIRELGRKDGPGRPIVFGTTDKFLMEFNLKSLDDLPRKNEFPRLTSGSDTLEGEDA